MQELQPEGLSLHARTASARLLPQGPLQGLWDDLIESNLSSTIYVDMSDSIRMGSAPKRGARGGQKNKEY